MFGATARLLRCIARLESASRRSERLSLLKEAGATEEEVDELRKTIRDLDEELDSLAGKQMPAPDVEIDRVLAQECSVEILNR